MAEGTGLIWKWGTAVSAEESSHERPARRHQVLSHGRNMWSRTASCSPLQDTVCSSRLSRSPVVWRHDNGSAHLAQTLEACAVIRRSLIDKRLAFVNVLPTSILIKGCRLGTLTCAVVGWSLASAAVGGWSWVHARYLCDKGAPPSARPAAKICIKITKIQTPVRSGEKYCILLKIGELGVNCRHEDAT
jgi:hypothetical protein